MGGLSGGCLNIFLHFVDCETRAFADSASTLHTMAATRHYVLVVALHNSALLLRWGRCRAQIERATSRGAISGPTSRLKIVVLIFLLQSFDGCLVWTNNRVLIRLLNPIFRLRLGRLPLRLTKHHRHRTVTPNA